MTPNDPRHGTNAGYIAHTFDREPACEPCRTAHADYRRGLRARRYIARQDRLYIDSTGTVRRIRALQAIGWSLSDIDEALGHRAGTNYAHNLTRQERVHLTTAQRVAAVYDKLSMRLGPSDRCRSAARRRGWLPPLVWDDDTIDDPDARPHGGRDRSYKHDIDPITVERVLAGDRLPMTHAESRAVVARARDLGWSEEQIKQRTGITRATDKTRFGAHLPDCGCKPGTAKNGWIEKRAAKCERPDWNVSRDLREMRAGAVAS
jgi:hypothetical protein